MALSGSYKLTCFYNGGNLLFSWTATQSPYNNTSTINWTLAVGDLAVEYQGNLLIDGEKVFSGGNLSMYPGFSPFAPGKELGSGTFTITHEPNAEASFKVRFAGYMTTTSTTSFPIMDDQTTFTLDAIDTTSKVSATNANIGSATTITITRYASSYTHTLTYKFGSLTGTIATKTASTRINWTVPTSFYAQIPNANYGTCTITCQTYSGSTLIGTATTTFRASVPGDACAPTLSPVITDVNSDTVALTGNNKKLIRFESLVEFQSGATARNGATLKTQSVVNGSITKTDFAIGTIDSPETPDFIFSATDSRGLTTTQTYTADMVMYVKPTCYQKVKTELVGATGAKITLTIHGNYFHGNFGTVDNTYTFGVRYAEANNDIGEWQELPAAMFPTLGDDNEYELTVEINNLEYNKSYIVQSYLRDKLNYVESTVYTVRVLPVFDWDKDDFNFNVPVNISADTLDIHNETVLRHGATTNNTVLSGSGGHIYLRPGGTNDTSGEVRITAQGDIEITGDIIINGVSLITALQNKGII